LLITIFAINNSLSFIDIDFIFETKFAMP
jgi:hypothetical protein